ncbi:TPA: aromatic acid exporter family protein, partial [Staphylococcus aureus]|nr:aromatic acid exporter family protein [Staphylococcus aureus]
VQEGVITSCVILLHVFNAKSIDAHLIVNETLLLLIGLSIAFTMNLMMPSLDKQLDEYKCKIEQQIADIFSKYSYICEKYEDTIAIEFEALLLNIKKAKSIAFRDVKNHFVRNENSYYHYFDMREEQVELLMRMKPLIESICHKDPLLNDVASLLKEIGLNVNSNDYTAMRLHNLYETRLKLDELPLPTTHKALNSRASIIQILNELEEYLQIKSQFGSLKMHSEVA